MNCFDKVAAGRRTTGEITPALAYWGITIRLIRKRNRLLRKRATLLIQLVKLAREANAELQAMYKDNGADRLRKTRFPA